MSPRFPFDRGEHKGIPGDKIIEISNIPRKYGQAARDGLGESLGTHGQGEREV